VKRKQSGKEGEKDVSLWLYPGEVVIRYTSKGNTHPWDGLEIENIAASGSYFQFVVHVCTSYHFYAGIGFQIPPSEPRSSRAESKMYVAHPSGITEKHLSHTIAFRALVLLMLRNLVCC
jgi:hypothetical protein